MDSNAEAKQKIEKFGGTTDYVIWKMKMTSLFDNLGLEEALDEDDNMPYLY